MKKGKQNIVIKGAKVHNLKNISLEIPRHQMTVITGVSGSGKSSLAFDTLHAEGQRRYLESFSVYARQFLGLINKPDVEKIEGLPPTIAISQQTAGRSSRSTVGTMTEIYDFLRLLFARIGQPHCPRCNRPLVKQSLEKMIRKIFSWPNGSEVIILSTTKKKLDLLKAKGFKRVRWQNKIYQIENLIKDKKRDLSHLEVVVDGLVLNKKNRDRIRIIDSLETALKLGNGFLTIQLSQFGKKEDLIFSQKYFCPDDHFSLAEIDHRLFSFNSPQGACPGCSGLGVRSEIDRNLVIPNPRLTLGEKAIRPSIKSKILEDLAKKYKFSLDVPVKDLDKKIVNLIFNEGIVPDLKRRHREASSELARAEIEKYMTTKVCPECHGQRLKPAALAVQLAKHSIVDISRLSLADALFFFKKLKLNKSEKGLIGSLLSSIKERLELLIEVNLEYLSLARGSTSLSAGELQRIRLATQIGSKLTEVVYILDEPSIGLHPKDQQKLIRSLKNLKALNNTIIIVEHDEETIKASDWVIDIGPAAGENGGRVIFTGTPQKLIKSSSLTGKYLSGKLKIETNKEKPFSPQKSKWLVLKGAQEHNLKKVNLKIPLGALVTVTGVSGSGKSSLINDTLARALKKKFYQTKVKPGRYQSLIGLEEIDKVVIANQSPIGKTPRSNPATYTGIFTAIREIFAQTKEAKRAGYQAKHFSFNLKGGRCEECQGAGLKKVEMYFLMDEYVICPECQGQRYNADILEVRYKGVNIAEVLEMSIDEALKFFKEHAGLRDKLKTLQEIGLGYIKLGQSATSFSGGEAQRIKLGTELARQATGRTIYILDEPTTGLHPADIKNLLIVLRRLVAKGNTVLVVEHNLDVIKDADWVIDLGPEGGDKGGEIIAQGTPKEISKVKKSYTGQWLRKLT